MQLFKCAICGNIITHVKKSGVPVMCCGRKMEELVPGTSDGAAEKHVPVIKQDGNKVVVEIGSVEHPMVDAHYIEWIVLETEKGVLRRNLNPGEAPKAEFVLADDDKVVAAYEYCNLHGFWKAE